MLILIIYLIKSRWGRGGGGQYTLYKPLSCMQVSTPFLQFKHENEELYSQTSGELRKLCIHDPSQRLSFL